MSESPEGQWHLDKRIPVALVMTIIVQTVGAVWWAATMQAELGRLSADMIRQEAAITRNSSRVETQTVSNAVITQELTSIRATLQRLETQGEAMNNLLRNIGTEGRR